MTYKSLREITFLSILTAFIFIIGVLIMIFATGSFNYLWGVSIIFGVITVATGALIWARFRQIEEVQRRQVQWQSVEERERILSAVSELRRLVGRWGGLNDDMHEIRKRSLLISIKDKEDFASSSDEIYETLQHTEHIINRQIQSLGKQIDSLRDPYIAAGVGDEIRALLQETPWIHTWVSYWEGIAKEDFRL